MKRMRGVLILLAVGALISCSNPSSSTKSWMVSTFAGSAGQAGSTDDTDTTTALFKWPTGVAVDEDGNVYVADQGNHLIRRITPEGVVSTIAGSTGGSHNGSGAAAQFVHPLTWRWMKMAMCM